MSEVVLEVRATGYLGGAGHGNRYRASDEGPERLKVYYRQSHGVGDRVARLFGFGSQKEFGEAYVDREAMRELREKNVLITEEDLRAGGHASYSLYLVDDAAAR